MYDNTGAARGINQNGQDHKIPAEYFGKGAVLGASIAPQRERRPMESSFDAVSHGLEESFAALDRLAERLHLVLQPELPSPVGVGNAAGHGASQPLSEAVCRLHDLRGRLEHMTNRINNLTARLDS